MRKLSIVLAIIIAFTLNPAHLGATTQPQKIKSITQVLHPLEYYHDQVTAWEDLIKSNSENADAWMNYYLACRIVNILTRNNVHDLDHIYGQLSESVDGTYEYHYLSYLHEKGNTPQFHHLEKAFAINSERTETYSHFITYHTVEGNKQKLQKFTKLWLDSGEIAPEILHWNYNAIIALEKNAILLTYGDNDTYPAWMLQQVHHIRPDVNVINIHLLKIRKYIDKVFEDIQIPQYPTTENEDYVWIDDVTPVVDYMFQKSKRPMYVNVTLPKIIRDNYKEVLYTIGLAFRYSEKSFDNMAVLKNNYENKFLTDYLKVRLSTDKLTSVADAMNVNYLPAFVSLYKHYIKSGATKKSEQIKDVIQNIAKASGREQEIEKIIGRSPIVYKNIKSHINIKAIDKSMKQITPNLWASSTETLNESYEQFLLDLLKQKEFELLADCKADRVDWIGMLPEKFIGEKDDILLEQNPDWPAMPVVNISYKAAELYCEWLTMVYNSYNKKKQHKKVVFRLPTKDEWQYAAIERENAPYPWGGYYPRNAKGCYLANFYSHDLEPCNDCDDKDSGSIDGGFFPVHGTAYFPNKYGLYNTSGNVAEMVAGGSTVIGGSWNDPPEECKLDSEKPFTEPSSTIGFRVFMDVISEGSN